MLDSRPTTASPASPAASPASALATDAALIVGVLLLLAVVAGLLWPQLVDPVQYTRTEQGVVTDEVALAQQFDGDGWYAVIAAVTGAVAGAVLSWWRDRDPVATVLLLVVGGAAAAWAMALVGTAVGPPDPAVVLAEAAPGATAAAQVKVHAAASYFVWPIALLFGAVVVLWSRRSSHVQTQ